MQNLPCSVNAAVARPAGFPLSNKDSPPLTASTFFAASAHAINPSSHAATLVDDDWSPNLSATLYRVDKWGPPYFSVNSSGNISVHPDGESSDKEIDLLKVVKKVSDPTSADSLQLPIIIQFPELLKHRLESLNIAFKFAIESLGYKSRYQGVFPIKVNQNRFIVENFPIFGAPFRFGLEAGSKAELFIAMCCFTKGDKDAYLVCNGYKDIEFIYLAMIARKLGYNTYIVIEQEEEIDIVIDLSKKLEIQPVIGLRAKLKTGHEGHWGSTSGVRGKFGLTPTQILQIVQKLENGGMLSSLKLLHFHIGSQIPSTDVVSSAVTEASQIYCQLAAKGAPMEIIDIGGGLGIDYDGSRLETSNDSIGYTLREYAEAVVQAAKETCDKNSIDHPVICSESGRALVSHQSILVFDIISTRDYKLPELSATGLKYLVEGFSEDVRAHYNKLHDAAVRVEHDICSHHAKQLQQLCLEQFKQGSLGLEQLAAVDNLCKLVDEVTEVKDPARYYQMNLSMFASTIDFVLVNQHFPVIPIHRLAKKPTITGALSDLTCDSDGTIKKFIGDKSTLPLHEFPGGDDDGKYYLGVFLAGAYQEAIGGFHNLFGPTNIVQVEHSNDVDDGFIVKRTKPGMSLTGLLERMTYNSQTVLENIRRFTNNNPLVEHLACFLDKLPYLVSTSSCVDKALNNN